MCSTPVYFGDGFSAFGLFHPPHRGVRRQPILFVPPWGWAEVASYRARRDWAMRLAAAGHPVLRFAYPATGNSSGSPSDSDLVATWIASVGAAARRLAAAASADRVVAVGLGLGGLLTLQAVTDAPIDGVALWAPPRNGATFVRETRAIAAMEDLGRSDPPLPEGWIEAGGFLLSAETRESLRRLAGTVEPSGLRRALLLGRDGVEAPTEIEQGLQQAGVETETAAGHGWGGMVEHPESGRLPLAVADILDGWLAADDDFTGLPDEADGRPEAASATIGVGAGEVEEEAAFVEEGWGRRFGVTTIPPAGGGRVGLLLLNAGAVSNVGPNRMWVDLARAAAAQGVVSLRVDLEGIGEADGEVGGELRGAAFNDGRYEGQVRSAIRTFRERTSVSQIVIVGLCAGGHNAFRAADESGVEEVILVNASGLRWDEELLRRRVEPDLARALTLRKAGRLLAGRIRGRRLLDVLRSMVRRAAKATFGLVRRFDPHRPPTHDELVEADLERVAESSVRVTLAFSGEEPFERELRASGMAETIAAYPSFELRSLPGQDHTLRLNSSQAALRELILGKLRQRVAADGRAIAGRPEAG